MMRALLLFCERRLQFLDPSQLKLADGATTFGESHIPIARLADDVGCNGAIGSVRFWDFMGQPVAVKIFGGAVDAAYTAGEIATYARLFHHLGGADGIRNAGIVVPLGITVVMVEQQREGRRREGRHRSSLALVLEEWGEPRARDLLGLMRENPEGPKGGWRVTLRVVKSTAKALAAMHSAGISYNDLKPDNIMVNVDKRGELVDSALGDMSHALPSTEPVRVLRMSSCALVAFF
jgi:serine/threonine protein kinase